MVREDEIDYNFYGVNIEMGNYDMMLTYAVVSEILGAVGAFLQKWKMCEASWSLIERGEVYGRGKVVSVGRIQKEMIILGNATAVGTTVGMGSA